MKSLVELLKKCLLNLNFFPLGEHMKHLMCVSYLFIVNIITQPFHCKRAFHTKILECINV